MRFLAFIFVFLLLLGCNKVVKPKKPNNLIPKEQMVNIIYDIYIMNAAKGIQKVKLEEQGIMPENFVYQKHNIDSLQFALSNDYYAYDTETYKKIIADVKAKVNSEKKYYEALIEKEEKREKAKKDSIKKLRDTLKTQSGEVKQKVKKPLKNLD
jgi:ubiquitin